jgi:hypothetical protein
MSVFLSTQNQLFYQWNGEKIINKSESAVERKVEFLLHFSNDRKSFQDMDLMSYFGTLKGQSLTKILKYELRDKRSWVKSILFDDANWNCTFSTPMHKSEKSK